MSYSANVPDALILQSRLFAGLQQLKGVRGDRLDRKGYGAGGSVFLACTHLLECVTDLSQA